MAVRDGCNVVLQAKLKLSECGSPIYCRERSMRTNDGLMIESSLVAAAAAAAEAAAVAARHARHT